MNKYIVKYECDIAFDSETKPLIMGSERYERVDFHLPDNFIFLTSKVKLL